MEYEMTETKKYYAFISYKREEEKWADWLQKKLEHYKLPSNLNGREDLPKSIRPVFKDTTELNPTYLPQQIQEALADSKFLIVICSPRSAKSEWVNKEVETFIEMGRTDYIIPFIIEGEPHAADPESECYPKALRDLPANKEILGANINEFSKNAALVKVVAQMLGLKFDTLWQRYARESKKKRTLLFTLLVSIIIGTTGIAYYTWNQNNKLKEANTALLRSQIQQELSMSKNYLLLGNPVMAMAHMANINSHMELLDSIQKKELNELTKSANDSLSNCPIILCDIGSTEGSVLSAAEIIKKSSTLELKCTENEWGILEKWHLLTSPANKMEKKDTISLEDPKHGLITNGNYKYIAFNDKEAYDDNEPEISNRGRGGILVYSVETGEQTGYIRPISFNNFLTYPMALSLDGNKMIYKEETLTTANIYLVDFKGKTKTSLKEWAIDDLNGGVDFTGAFSPDGEMFYIIDEETKIISLFDAENLKTIYEFELEEYDIVQWDKGNNLCVSLYGHTLKWKRNADKLYFERTINNIVADVCISDDGKYVAATSKMGELYIWSREKLSCLWHGKTMEDAECIEFTHKGDYLWLTTGYDGMIGVDWSHNMKQIIMDNNANFTYELWPNADSNYMYITEDDNYCITYYSNGLHYSVFDIKNSHDLFSVKTKSEDPRICYIKEKGLIGFVTKQGVDVYTMNGKIVNKSISKDNKMFANERFEPLNYGHIDYTGDVDSDKKNILTCKKESFDKSYVVEGYYDGKVKVYRNKQ